MHVQARPASFVLHAYAEAPLARESNSTHLSSADARTQFDRGAGGVLGVGIAATNGVLQGPDAFTLSMISGGPEHLDQPLMFSLCFLNPVSRATVRLASADPLATPGAQRKPF